MLMTPCVALNRIPSAFFSNITAASSYIGAKHHGAFCPWLRVQLPRKSPVFAKAAGRITSPHSPVAAI